MNIIQISSEINLKNYDFFPPELTIENCHFCRLTIYCQIGLAIDNLKYKGIAVNVLNTLISNNNKKKI